MQLNDIKPTTKLKKEKRVARGGKRGTYSGQGMKGQKSRAGRKLEPPIRGLIKRYHKLRGYKFNPSTKKSVASINLSILDKNFKEGEVVSPKVLIDRKIIRRISGKTPEVKILGNGSISKKLVIKGCDLSKSAEEKLIK